MFGIGGGELFLIALVALIIFGPQRLPELARAAAKGYKELLKLRRQVDSTLDDVKRDLQIDRELGELGLSEPLSTGTPPVRPPQDERIAARAATVAQRPAPIRSEYHRDPLPAGPEGGRSSFEVLPVPDEDDYLVPPAAPASNTGPDAEDYLGGRA
jgi:TatA/E family protein of Tat protein translocase